MTRRIDRPAEHRIHALDDATAKAKAGRSLFERHVQATAEDQGERLRDALGLPRNLAISFGSRAPDAANDAADGPLQGESERDDGR